MKTSRSRNVYLCMRTREYGTKNYYRANLSTLRSMIEGDRNGFCQIFKIDSKQGFYVENFHIFTNHMRQCHTLNTNSAPVILYSKDKSFSKFGAIDQCLVSQAPVQNMMMYSSSSRKQFSMYAISKSNWLLHLDIGSGEIIHALHLSNKFKFRSIAWDVVEERFFVSSIKSRNQNSPVMAMQIFSVWPFTYNGLFEICPAAFGTNVSDAMLSNYILIVCYTNSIVRLYSFPHPKTLSSNSRLLFNVSSDEMKSMENLFLKIELKNNPQMLMEISAPKCMLSIGGLPWHYIISHKTFLGLYEVKSLEGNSKCHPGFLGSEDLQLEPDKCFFHPDESGKIVLLGSDYISMFKIVHERHKNACASSKLKKLYTIGAREIEQRADQAVTYSKSGRMIKPMLSEGTLQRNLYKTIHCASFEDELDLVVVVVPQRESGDWHGVVHFYDNQSGRLVAKYRLEEGWNVDEEHVVELDLDTLYHFTKDRGRHVLYVHRLKLDVLAGGDLT